MKLAGLALPVLLVMSPVMAQTPGTPAFSTVSSETFSSDRTGVTLIDIREQAEWDQTGVPEGAKRVSTSRPDFVDAILAELGGDKSKPVAVFCRSGTRSLKAAETLAAAGFTNVINVGDGMMGRDGVGKGWQAAGLPLKPADCTTC